MFSGTFRQIITSMRLFIIGLGSYNFGGLFAQAIIGGEFKRLDLYFTIPLFFILLFYYLFKNK